MFKPIRFTVRIAAVILWIIGGLLAIACLFPFLPLKARLRMIHHWSRWLMVFFGVRIIAHGKPVLEGPVFWVANHVSWVDIFVINRVRPASFIAKREIRGWPIIGWMVAGAGTVFIDRRQRQAIRVVGEQMKDRFARGEAVGLFPEGTTSPGFDVAEFHTSLFEPAIRAGVTIQPIALRFYLAGKRSDHAAFVGQQSLVANVCRLLNAGSTTVEVDFLPPMDAARARELGRVQVAEHMHAVIRAAVRKDLDGDALAHNPHAVSSVQ